MASGTGGDADLGEDKASDKLDVISLMKLYKGNTS